METPKPVLSPKAVFASYLFAIKNSLGNAMFQSLFLEKADGELVDILKGGDIACANYASSILYRFKYIKEPHATVEGTEKDLIDSGWTLVTEPQEGDVIIWQPNFDHDPKAEHLHIGFSIGGDQAISNSTTLKYPVEHHLTFGTKEDGAPRREIKAIYRREPSV
ncbi:MAG: hypothetical protein U0487_00140 [Patescibacteria group bacterium]